MGNLVGLACTQNCLALLGLFASATLCVVIQMSSVLSTATLREKELLLNM